MSLRRYVTIFILIAAAISAAVLTLSTHSKKDREEWEKTKAAYLAAGESLDPNLPYAVPVPDKELIKTIIKFADALKSDSNSLVSGVIRIGQLHSIGQPLEQGLRNRIWNDDQLLELQTTLEGIDPRSDLIDSFRCDIVKHMMILDVLENLGSTSQTKSLIGNLSSRQLRRQILPARIYLIKMNHGGAIRPLLSSKSYNEVRKLAEATSATYGPPTSDDPNYQLIYLLSGATELAINQTGQLQAFLSQAATACALERYFIANQSYPDALQALVPEFVTSVPLDPMDNRPMRYKKTDDGRYQLHSVGKDGIDNGGDRSEVTWNYQTTQP